MSNAWLIYERRGLVDVVPLIDTPKGISQSILYYENGVAKKPSIVTLLGDFDPKKPLYSRIVVENRE